VTVRRRTNTVGGLARLKPSRQLAILAVGVAVVAFLIGYGVSALAFSASSSPNEVILVPDVREMTIDQATREMSDLGLTLAVGDSLPNAEVEAGAVLAQEPLPGREVSAGTLVTVILSTGESRSVVPDVFSMTAPMAIRSLEAAGYHVIIQEVPVQSEVGRVLGVEPSAGTSLPLADTVTVLVGTGLGYIRMPDVMGLQEDSARAAIDRVGLRIDEVMYEPSETIEPYRVIGQTPFAGDSLGGDESVQLRVTMPEVR